MNKIINIKGTLKQVPLLHFNERKVDNVILLKGITEKEDKFIDEQGFYKYKDCVVDLKNIILYGEIDLTKEEDLNLIEENDIITENLSNENMAYMYSGFDYEKGTVELKGDILQGFPTINSVDWFKYNYCRIGKPERIICFVVNKLWLSE